MSSNVTVVARPAFPIFGVLGLMFIGLKLTGYLTWSWAWVLAPFWAPVVLAVGLLLFFTLLVPLLFAAVAVVASFFGNFFTKKAGLR